MEEGNPALITAITVPEKSVKIVKTLLERHHILNKNHKIQRAADHSNHFIVPTTCKDYTTITEVLKELGANVDQTLTLQHVSAMAQTELSDSNPFIAVVHQWLEEIDPENLTGAAIHDLLDYLPKRYSVYPPMLLLPPTTFSTSSWNILMASVQETKKLSLFASIAKALSVTHIALNAPIPQSVPDLISDSVKENMIRSPAHLLPLHGSFGPPASSSPPTAVDFENAFWVLHRQNGITQIWAPVYTMFSRGNIREKTRLLTLPSTNANNLDSGRYTAVDLFAGIGYFAFSYVKACAELVLGFEINPWSVEGLRRGAEANRWNAEIVRAEGRNLLNETIEKNPKIVVFEMDNVHAAGVVIRLRDQIAPIRHVNLGLLPTSRSAWNLAVQLVDEEFGGWIHVHENFKEDDLQRMVDETMRCVDAYCIMKFRRNAGGARLEHVERVKAYAPGVAHYVLDIYIPGVQNDPH